MFKRVALVLSLFPGMVFASVTQPTLSNVSVEKNYVCHKYTDNGIDANLGQYTSEGPVTLLDTEVTQNKEGFNIGKNSLFPEGNNLINPVGGSISGQAGNKDSMIFKRLDDDKKLYFIIYLFDTDPESDGEINRAVFLADCEKK